MNPFYPPEAMGQTSVWIRLTQSAQPVKCAQPVYLNRNFRNTLDLAQDCLIHPITSSLLQGRRGTQFVCIRIRPFFLKVCISIWTLPSEGILQEVILTCECKRPEVHHVKIVRRISRIKTGRTRRNNQKGGHRTRINEKLTLTANKKGTPTGRTLNNREKPNLDSNKDSRFNQEYSSAWPVEAQCVSFIMCSEYGFFLRVCVFFFVERFSFAQKQIIKQASRLKPRLSSKLRRTQTSD